MTAHEGGSRHDGGLADGREILTRAAPPPDAVLRYGSGPDQVADLWLPPDGQHTREDRASGERAEEGRSDGGRARGGLGHGARAGSLGEVNPAAPIVVFLHGGFWRTAFDRSHAGPLAAALAAAGFVVCVPEYRRASQHASGWPGTFDDVAAAVDTLPAMVSAAAGPGRADRSRVVLAGHSAGGHLALWAAGRHRLPPGAPWRTVVAPPLRAVVGLAAVSNLITCHDQRVGGDAVLALLGGPPDAFRGRYATADPARLLPFGVPVWLVHGAADDVVPPQMSRAFAARARAAGDSVILRELPDCGHFGVIDPLSPAWPQVLGAFAAAAPL